MFLEFLSFELRYWLRGMMVWVFFVIIGLMIFGATSSDVITVGGSLQNTFRNAPWVIQNFYSFMAVLTLLMTTAFVNSAASRDFAYGTSGMIFTTPLSKRDYVFGRYLGSALVAVIPLMGTSMGIIIARFMPWVDPERFGPIDWAAHLKGILVFALPNTLFGAAVVFTIAVLTRSTIASFLGSLVLLVASALSDTLTQDLDNELLAAMIDPFGSRAFTLMTKYWTVADKNHLSLGIEGLLLWNRLLWMGVTVAILAFAYSRFSFAERSRKGKQKEEEEPASSMPVMVPLVEGSTGFTADWAAFRGALNFEFWGLVKTTSFIVILVAALLNCLPNLILSATESYGNSSYPVTYWIVNIVQGTLYLFLISMITYYAGVLVWRERDAKMDEIEDCTPRANWIQYAAKFGALMGSLVLIQTLVMLVGIGVQTYYGYTRYQLDLYLTELFFADFSLLVLLAVLAFFVHVISPNKYAGYFGFIGFMIANAFIWRPLNVATRLVRYASRPDYTYSDMFGFAPYRDTWLWFTLYWALFALLVVAASILLWPRGKETSLAKRLKEVRLRWHGSTRTVVSGIAVAFLAVLGWLSYNTLVLNKVVGPDTVLDRQAEYEKNYKKLASAPQPRVTAIKYQIDLRPETRGMTMKAQQTIINQTKQPISLVYLNLDPDFEYTVAIDGGQLDKDDQPLKFQTYKLSPPMQPGEARQMRFTVAFEPKGISNSVRAVQIAQNGTFFNNGIAPQIGYQTDRELDDRNDRKKRGLPEKDLMPALERNCTEHCMNTYLSNSSDWVSVETVMSTSPDQIAVAPGTLQREWMENGRRFFEYKLDKNSMNFYAFASARYEVAREEINGIKAEVYWHKEHPWNIEKMRKSIRNSLDYFTKNFGPYYHKQVRILEFPRVASFAQAFPGTMPYSESIGFIAKLDKPDSIDFVHYVVAHEIGHQWWAHQVVGANMQGATLLSETLAQYSALMVMEKEYGRDMMRKFMEYEMDRYLRARGAERLKERPLINVEAQQGYIHYQKGSAAMYYLKEMIGEEAVNRALRKVIEKYAYAEPPYPTAHVLVDALREETPENLRYLIKDLFEDMTLFGNRTLEAKAAKRPDGKFDVTINVETKKFKADDKGNEVEVAVADYIDIGAFAKPEKDKKYGKTLYRQRLLMKSGQAQYKFVTDELPEKAGIDPFRMLVDRVPDDNLKKVSGS